MVPGFAAGDLHICSFYAPGSLSRFGGRYKLASQLLLFARAGARQSAQTLSQSSLPALSHLGLVGGTPPGEPWYRTSLMYRTGFPVSVRFGVKWAESHILLRARPTSGAASQSLAAAIDAVRH